MLITTQVHSTVPGQYSTCPGTAVVTKLLMLITTQVHSTVPGQYSTCPGTAVVTKLLMLITTQVHSTVPGQYSTCPGTAVVTKLLMLITTQVHSTVPGQYSTCPGTAVVTKQHLCSEQSPVLGMSWHRHGSVLALLMCEGGRRRENTSCGGTDSERAILLMLEWEEQER